MNKYVIALYIRLSLEDELYDSMSIENQRLALRQYADTLNEQDIEYVEFVDNGYSGTNFERPAVQQLLEQVQQSKINCIIVKDFSRFGRNSLEVGYLMERVFPVFRTRFISIQDHFDSNEHKGDTGGIDVAFKYLIAEYYSKDLSEKSKSAKYAKMRRGEYQAKTCFYGYQVTADKKLVPDENTAPVVKMIFELAHQGKSAFEIVQALYAKKIPTPGEYKAASRGKSWHDTSNTNGTWQRSMVLRILNDERYAGTYIMCKKAVVEVGGRNCRERDESEWIKIPNHHPAIIDKTFYDKVQSKLRKCNCVKTKVHEYPLKSKVICGCCNHTMQRTYSFFSCKYARVDKSYKCNRERVYESELEATIFEIIKKQAEIFLSLNKLNVSDTVLENQNVKVAEYESAMQQLLECKRRLYEQFVVEEISGADYKSQKESLDTELAEIKRIHASVSSKATQSKATQDENKKLTLIVPEVKSADSLTRGLVEALIDKVYVFSGERIEVVWKFDKFC